MNTSYSLGNYQTNEQGVFIAMDIYTLSKILGHSSVTVTEEAYLDLTEDDIGRRYRNFSPVEHMGY